MTEAAGIYKKLKMMILKHENSYNNIALFAFI